LKKPHIDNENILKYTKFKLKVVRRKDGYMISKDQQLHYELNEAFKTAEIPGMAVTIFTKDNILYKEELGYANVEKKIPFTVNTIMNIASISKTFIAVALMMAVEDGILDLDEDVNNILPFKVTNPYFSNNKISLRNLATHVSGIKDDDEIYNLNSYCATNCKEMPLKDFLYNYLSPKGKWYKKENFLNRRVGTSYEYSNIASALVGYCIEIKSKIPYSKYVRENIFKKLNMNNCGWNQNEFNSEFPVLNYSKIRINFEENKYYLGLSKKALPPYKLVTYPDGGVTTSINDLTRFLLKIMKRDECKFISSKSIDLMLKKQFVESNIPNELKERNHNMGLFWKYTKSGSFGHTGDDPGVSTLMSVRENGVAVIMFMNTDATTIGKDNLSKFYNILGKYCDKVRPN